MRKPLAIGVATVAVVLSLGLAACGSSDDSSDLSNSELISKADAVCTDYNNKLIKLQEDSGLSNQSSKTQIVGFISDSIVPLYKDQIDELRALEPNADDAEAYDDIINTLESELKTVENDPAAAYDENNPFAGASKKADEFGMKVCGGN